MRAGWFTPVGTLRIVVRTRWPSDVKSVCAQMAAVREWSKKIKRQARRSGAVCVSTRDG